MENLRVYCVTYNVGTSSPDQQLNDLLSLTKERKNDKDLVDLYVVAFQEVKAQPLNMVLDIILQDPWTNACTEILHRYRYIKLKSIRLQGLILSVYCLDKHLKNMREIEADYTRTGLSGFWGNKGAVSIRLSIYGCSLCFINSHLSAHDNKLDDRVQDYNSIVEDQNFHVDEATAIFFHDYVFWMGDLNFRILEEFDKTPEEIEKIIAKKNLKQLLEYDQLKHVMKNRIAFHELTEQDPTFPPTFKYEVGTSRYDYKRRPAWCDRILYKVNSNVYENVTLQVEQLSYKHHPAYNLSDHKPVSADFIIKMPEVTLPDNVDNLDGQVFSDFSERVVEFDKIDTWNLDEENVSVYKFTRDAPKTTEDWIGLYKDNFSCLDVYEYYEYVSKCSSPTPDGSPSKSAEVGKKYKMTFSELPSHLKGRYCLIYISQSEDKVLSVLGISEPFNIVKVDSD